MEKPFRTIDEQIDILRSRGIVIDDIETARKALETISYYRLSGYSYPFRQYDKESRTRSDQFSPNTHLEQILALYRFDERLRTTTFQELSRIEVGLRALIGYTLGTEHPYLHLASLRLGPSGFNKENNHETDEYRRWISSYNRNLRRSQEDFIQHYKSEYSGKLPIWVAVHILEWGQLAMLFKMAPIHCQDSIASSLQLSRPQVNSWLENLRILRNICAHQGRLFNRTLRQVKLPQDAERIGIKNLSPMRNKCFDQLTLVQYLTRTMGLGDGTALPSVLAAFPCDRCPSPLRATGTPDNWQSLPLWACRHTEENRRARYAIRRTIDLLLGVRLRLVSRTRPRPRAARTNKGRHALPRRRTWRPCVCAVQRIASMTRTPSSTLT